MSENNINPVTGRTEMIRLTYASWVRYHAEPSRDKYELLFQPDNLMLFLTECYDNLENKESYADDHIVQAIPVDDEWFDDPAMGNVDPSLLFDTQKKLVEKFKTYGLNHTLYMYALMVTGMSKNSDTACRLSRDTVETIRKYYAALLNDPNFSAYVCPYAVNIIECLMEGNRFTKMAKDYFANGIIAYNEELDNANKVFVSNIGKNDFVKELTVKAIPIVFKEIHPSGSLTVKEIREYSDRSLYYHLGSPKNHIAENYEQHLEAVRAHPGRFADKLVLDDNVLDRLGINRNSANSEELRRAVKDDLKKYYCDEQLYMGYNLTFELNMLDSSVRLLGLLKEQLTSENTSFETEDNP